MSEDNNDYKAKYEELEKKLGSSVQLPKNDAEKLDLMRRINNIEGASSSLSDSEAASTAMALAQEHGLSIQQADAIVSGQMVQSAKAKKQAEANAPKQETANTVSEQEVMGILKEWNASDAGLHQILDDDLIKKAKSGKMTRSEAELLAKAAGGVRPEGLGGLRKPDKPEKSVDYETAFAEHEQLMNNPKSPLVVYNPQHPEYQKALKRQEELEKVLFS